MDTNLYEQRTRVQNQQTNTFLKGMDTDTSDMLLGSDQYRYAENVRIVTNKDSDTGELHLVDGTTELYKIGGNDIVAVNSIRNITVFIVVDSNIEHQYWSVYKSVDGKTPVLIFGPCEEKLWYDDIESVPSIDDIRNSITTVLRWEAEKNIKLYIADSTGKHPIMVLNVAEPYDSGNFDKAFAYQRTLLPPAEVSISSGSGSIMSGKVQYVYRLYSKNGAATPLSILSKTLSLYRNEYSGYEAEKRSGRSVNINVDISNRGNLDYIQVYRISYQNAGQLPKISLIKDEKLTGNLVDVGTNIEEDVAISELLSMFTPFIYPTQIESKGDYLFAANMKYSQDDVDSQFDSFKSESYSRHNKIFRIDEQNNSTIPEDWDSIEINYNDDNAFPQEGTPTYNDNDWKAFKINGNEYNGYGKYIGWKYIYEDIDITAQNQGDISNQHFTFRCGETYRFGIKLYDKYGRASSVKWIADIIIPDGYNVDNTGSSVKFRNVGIKFFKTSAWPENIYGWEIVRCERTIKDRKAITQGIIGFPLHEYYLDNTDENLSVNDTGLICNPGILSTELIRVLPSISGYHTSAISDNNIIIFSSAEYCYQYDDIKDILQSYKNQIYGSKIYECLPKYERIEDSAFFRSVQDINNNMAYGFEITTGTSIIGPETDKYWYVFNRRYSEDPRLQYSGYIQDFNDAAETRTVWFINYFTPDYTKFILSSDKTKYNFKELSFIDSPKPEDFAKNEQLVFKNNVTTIQNLQFVNWSTPLLLNISGRTETDVKDYMSNVVNSISAEAIVTLYPIGSGGKVILLEQEGTKIDIDSADQFNGSYFGNHVPKITVININKSTIPYGGYNKTAINNSQYISFGDYTNSNSIDIYSGDTNNSIFTYNASHNWYDSTYKNCYKMATIYAIPLETDIDIHAQYGTIYNVGGFTDYRIQDTAGAFDTYTQNKGAYLYNPAYNATPDIVGWTTPEQLDSKIDQFDTRIHYSNVKINNEDIDSWLQFQSANYIDVDTRYGEITDLKLFKDKLIFWQENATGILAVNERVVLNDQNDTQVVLGTGGVLERYDYFTTVYGQKKNQHARTMSNTSLYWWDGSNKEILLYQQKYDVTPLSTIKHIRNYINDGSESTTPFMAYDSKYKEVLMNVVNDECVVYNEYIEAFTSIYKFNPIYEALVNSKLYLTSGDTVYDYNSSDGTQSVLFTNNAKPRIKYVVNYQPTYNKVFDIQTFGGRFYGGGYDEDRSLPYDDNVKEFVGDKHARNNSDLKDIKITYKTPLKQESHISGDKMTNLEYDFRLTIPRNGDNLDWGDRMRGKTMQCEIKSYSNNLDFALQYVTTKFRMSWT